MPISYTVKRPQFGKSSSKSMKQSGKPVKCQCPWGGRRDGVRAPTCSAVTMSPCAGPKTQTARGQRPVAIAIWEVYTHTFIEIEEISSNKHSAKAPLGFCKCLGLALLSGKRCSIITKHLYDHPKTLSSYPLNLYLFQEGNREETSLNVGLYYREPRFT